MSDKAQAAARKRNKEKSKKEAQERERDNARVRQFLKERIRRNEEMGLGSSPEDSDAYYDDELPQKFGSNVKGLVYPERDPNTIRLNPETKVKGDEFLEKYVLAHELEHVNKKRPFASSDGDHERATRSFGDSEHEVRRKARSILQPAMEISDFLDTYKQGKTINIPEVLKKYAKQAGVPVDEIIDALVRNSATGNDKDVKAAHDKTKENLKRGRGLFGETFEKKMSAEEAYSPWQDLKKKVPKRSK